MKVKENILIDKSIEFAARIIKLQRYLVKDKKETVISKQIVRSGTSIGANINEANYGQSKADFISKLHISLKEVSESIYWLMLLKNTKIFEYDCDNTIRLAEEIKRMLISSINTAKKNNN